MKPSEIVEGGLYRGSTGGARKVIEINPDTSLSWAHVNDKMEPINSFGRCCYIENFARWAKERVQPPNSPK